MMADTQNEHRQRVSSAPPLPPRRLPSPLPLGNGDVATAANAVPANGVIPPRTPIENDSTASSSGISGEQPALSTVTTDQPSEVLPKTMTPPPLPSRRSVTSSTPGSRPAGGGHKSALSVSVIPATPPDSRTPVDRPPVTAPPALPAQQHTTARQGTSETATSQLDQHKEEAPLRPKRISPSVRPVSSPPSDTPPPALMGPTTKIWLIAASLLGISCFLRHWWSIILSVILVGYASLASSRTPSVPTDTDERPQGSGGEASVNWINATMETLFPLISTDVLTPVIDLLEDALMEQVPPVVTSVRLASASLGRQPIRLTSLRTMDDDEWFSLLSQHKTVSHSKTKSGSSLSSIASRFVPGLSRSESQGASLRSSSSRRRSDPVSDRTAQLSPSEVEQEASRRRKRDIVLRRLSRRRAQQSLEPSSPARQQQVSSKQGGEELEAGPNDDVFVTEGENGDAEALAASEGDAVGQYINYQIAFQYQRTASTLQKGWGLHVLAYLGIGIRGLGQTEAPVYIDLISLKGTVNMRILLSATPPFARTGTFFFSKIPEFDISAKPLVRNAFNAMDLPLIKPYVERSVAEVAKAFVSPKSYTLDVDRLLLGREASLRTMSIGVLHIIIHGASDLARTDALGSCDPYVTVSMTKFPKPMFSTRTIINTQNPSWEEPAFILVAEEAVQAGERVRLRVSDSDRMSADDVLGVVEVELADLIDRNSSDDSNGFRCRTDDLTADKPGMRVQGSLDWSIRFCPLWQMSPEQVADRLAKIKQGRKGEPKGVASPWWMQALQRLVGETPDWESERKERRKETLEWFTGEREKDELEANTMPSEQLRSGVLQFHVHQANELEIESIEGTYSSSTHHRKSAAGGKPALEDITDRTATENPVPPSAYVEVHLNDHLVYRTRTKQVTPEPYFNAVSERFVRDWTRAKICFVVRDERDREHDPILGLVTLPLWQVLRDKCQLTRWFPLTGGLGWGLLRVSLLWKPVELGLPPNIAGYEVATLRISALASTDIRQYTDKSVSLMIETEFDAVRLAGSSSALGTPVTGRSTLSLSQEQSQGRAGVPLASPSSTRTAETFDFNPNDLSEVEWSLSKTLRLAVQYRHSCSVLVSFVSRSNVFKKRRIIGMGSIRLDGLPDDEDITQTIPIFGTSSVEQAVKAGQAHQDSLIPDTARTGASDAPDGGQSSTIGALSPTSRQPLDRKSSTRSRRSTSNRTFTDDDDNDQSDLPKAIGFVSITFRLRPGISRVHKKICKRDLRFKKTYEAWEAAREVEKGLDLVSPTAASRSAVDDLLAKGRREKEKMEDSDDSNGEDDGESDEDGQDSEGDEDDGSPGAKRGAGRGNVSDSEDEDSQGFMGERRAHSHALHKRHKGIFQLKVARTGRFVADKLNAKIRQRVNRAEGKDNRVRGPDLHVEHEGTSKL